MTNWIHRWLNPHCEHCSIERLEAKHCNACGVLTIQLEQANNTIRELTQALINKDKPIINTVTEEPRERRPIINRHKAWAVQRQELEANDRAQFKILQDKKKEEDAAIEKKPLTPVILNQVQTVEEIEAELQINEK